MKITIIGAGSAVFSLNAIKDLCLTPNLSGLTLCLMDISEERLNTSYKICTRYAAELNFNINVEKTTDRALALQGSDYVINTALGCGHKRMLEGLEVAKKHGYKYGGSYHVMHDEGFWINFSQFKLIEEIYLDVRKYCKDAWYILLANPVCAAITMLGRKYHDPKVVGLCEGTTVIKRIMNDLKIEDRENVTYNLSGINHFIWMTQCYYKGKDVFPMIDEFIANWDDTKYSTELNPKVQDIYKTFGVLPIGDTHNAGGGAWGWWYHVDAETEARYKTNPNAEWDGYYQGNPKRIEQMQKYADDESIKLTEVFPPNKSDELLIPLIESLECDIERHIVVNLLNDNEIVPGIPTDFNVEVTAVCSKKGIQPIKADRLPPAVLSHLMRDRIAPINLEIAAYESHSKRLLVDLVLMDPWTRSKEQAQAVVDEILDIPSNKEVKEWYK